jgi:hypothetical protein
MDSTDRVTLGKREVRRAERRLNKIFNQTRNTKKRFL